MMQRIVITRPEFYEGEADAITGMLRMGADRVHIRKPGASVVQIANLLEEIEPIYHTQLSLHDGFELADKYGIGGVHLNSRNPQPPAGFSGLISRSCHSVEELTRHTDCDYLFLSPIYPSISKPGYSNAALLEEFDRTIRTGLKLPPIIALGGVKPSKAAQLATLGFAGYAMLGAAWEPVDRRKFRLQYITPAGSADEIADSVAEAIRGGCRWVQLRMKEARSLDILTIASRIEPICHNADAVFLLDDRVDLVAAAKADGVHLGRNDMPVAATRRVLGPGYIIGATANTFDHIVEANSQGADYIGLGPYRYTTTKKNLSPVLGLEGYNRIISQCNKTGIRLPIVAIGGLDEADFEGLCQGGVSGFAISGAIARAENPENKTKEITHLIDNLPWIN